MRTFWIVTICYGALWLVWGIWSRIEYLKAVKDMNERIYQEALQERENADYEDGTEQHPYIHEADFESMKIKKIKP